MNDHLKIGAEGERLALQYLRKQGYDILARNFQSRSGEIDLIAYEGDILVFVEVKSRTTKEFGAPSDAVDADKQRTLRRVADEFRAAHDLHACSYRFDVVSILITRQSPQITLYRNAF